MTDSLASRRVLLVPHTGRSSNIESAVRAAKLLDEAGIDVRVLINDEEDPIADHDVLGQYTHVRHDEDAAEGAELVLVLGGDGTFLRAADMAHAVDLPVLGINLGHVGFLAEWESDSLEEALKRVIDRDYRIEDRMTLDVVVFDSGQEEIGRGWALNEVSIENLNRRGVLDATLEVDARPVASFGCDGVLISTPTGSTAYAFSAGGPVLWPELDAILVVPNNAHALFTKPLVVSPHSTVAVESNSDTSAAMAVMDGFRPVPMPPGSRVEVRKGERPVRWVRLDSSPFTDRLVSKLRLPVTGWRGPRKSADIEEASSRG
ncbi:putative inorganic polyphosphate/ATP-NAD kinase [Corynebacterium deserti GIMN1.010]|uniref:NAD kinase n=1 Tax=Corynebacterium deserti GIMN1.010 TaxID=931089 RepID=A0A0M5IR37_9CORY|nr:NAD kinase [Corynebacterium deserti]ALC05786.1 putative inorganic polyphosphate/ATP-NAD kinase [Corynebacterium deserti GIMN1.010]